MNAHKKISGSLVLAIVLFTGCGSTDTTLRTDTQQVQEIQSKVEEGKKVQLQKYLRENGDAYQSSVYSHDKQEILLVGIQGTTVTFYKFDTTSLVLKEKYSFDSIDGQIGIKKVGSDGKYTIISHKDSEASDYIFDSVSGELIKEKEYVLKNPKEIIQNTLAEGDTLVDFIYTPRKQGATVVIENAQGSSLYLYGLMNPENPLQEYRITAVDADDDIRDIMMLGDGKIAFSTFDKKTRYGDMKHLIKSEIVYDYFNKVELSNSDVALKQVVKEYMGNDRTFEGEVLNAIMPIQDDIYMVHTQSYKGFSVAGAKWYIFKIEGNSAEKIDDLGAYEDAELADIGFKLTNFKINKENHTLTYNTIYKYMNYTYDYARNTTTTKLLSTSEKDRLSKAANANITVYIKDEDFIYALGDVGKHTVFYRLNAQTLMLESKSKKREYGTIYDLGNDTIANSDLSLLGDGKVSIKRDFGNYIFDFFGNHGVWEYEVTKNIQYTHAYDDDILNILKNHTCQNGDTLEGENFNAIDVGNNLFIVDAFFANNTFSSNYILTVDLNNNTIKELDSMKLGSLSMKLVYIDKGHSTLVYRKSSSGFDEWGSINKINYKTGKALTSRKLYTGPGG